MVGLVSLVHIPALLLQVLPPPTGTPTLPLPPLPVISDPSRLTAVYQAMVGQWFAAVAPYAYDLFYSLAALELGVFGWNLWMNYHGDIRAAIMTTANKILIIGAFLSLLMNGQTWMADIMNMFVTVGKQASGIPSLGPSTLLLQGFKIFGVLLWQATKSGLMTDIPTALGLLIAGLLICAAFLVITFQFIITQVQIFLAIGMGYLFLGFGGSRWTTNYVERYFAYSVASGVKMMVLYMLAGAAWPLTDSWVAEASGGIFHTAASVESCWVIMSGALLYAGTVWFCSSLVSQIFGGSPNLSHSDFVSFMAPAVSAGVSAGITAAGLVAGPAGMAAGAAAAAGKAAGGAAASAAGGAAKGAATPSGGTPGQSSPGGAAGKAAGSMAQAGASAVGRMPGSGSHGTPPQFGGFHH